MNRDPQNTRLAEMQNEIQVINLNLTQNLGFPVVGDTGAFCLARSTGFSVPGSNPGWGHFVRACKTCYSRSVSLFRSVVMDLDDLWVMRGVFPNVNDS